MNTEKDIEEYIKAYMKKHNVTREEALTHSMVQEYIRFKKVWGISCGAA